MQHARLYQQLYTQPMALEPGARRAYEAAVMDYVDRLGGAEPLARKGQGKHESERRQRQLLTVSGDTAQVHIDGFIDKHVPAWVHQWYDVTDLDDVDEALLQLRADESIRHVLLVFDSPGGVVTGVPETGELIRALGERKNVFAVTDSMCCSAAYWLASQAEQVFATRSASVGSIGVYLALLEKSGYLEKLGVSVETIQSGRLKAAGAPWRPLADHERVHFQQQVDAIGKSFRASVKAGRPQVKQDSMEGQSFRGEEVLARGLIDAFVPSVRAALGQFRMDL